MTIGEFAAMTGLNAAVEEFGLEDRETRQVTILGPGGAPVATELTATI